MFDILGDKIKSGIYQIYNTITNKRYIGSSLDVNRRFAAHRYSLRNNIHHSKHLLNAWNKYGEHAFVFSCLEKCRPEDLLFLEKEYILKYNTTNRDFGYNTTADVENAPYLTEEGRRKISKAGKGRKWSEEQRKKMIASRTGVKLPKISETKKRLFALGIVKLKKITEVSEEEAKLWKLHISEGHKKFLESHPNYYGHPVRVYHGDDVMVFPSSKTAALYLGVCVDTIGNLIKRCARTQRMPYIIERISKEEYEKYKNINV